MIGSGLEYQAEQRDTDQEITMIYLLHVFASFWLGSNTFYNLNTRIFWV